VQVVEQSQQRAFQVLLEEHWRIVLKVTNTFGRTREDRGDLIQEISLQLWRAFPKYDAKRTFSTWMYRIALNVAISYARSSGYRNRWTVPLEDDHPQEVEAALDERSAFLREFIDGLDQLDRALMLLYMEEHSYQQISEILGISETNVATKISRLKKRARTEFENRM
jgi:RNA polymerase sigma-70 factor (ECF subfamily)